MVIAKKAAAKKVAPRKAGAAPRQRTGALPPEIVPVGHGSAEFVRLLAYGEPGSGKTVLAGTSPRCLILEADRGDESAASHGSKAQKWVIDDYNDLQEAYDYLRHGGTKEFDWVWLDSITLFQERGLDNIMADVVALKSHRHLWAPDKGEYGQNMNRLARHLREFKDLPLNFGATAHIKRVEDYEDGTTTYMPYVQGKDMPEKVCSYFGLVGWMSFTVKDEKELPVFSTRKDGKYYTKDRYGAIGRMLDPTIPKIMARIEAARSGKPSSSGTRTTPRKATAK